MYGGIDTTVRRSPSLAVLLVVAHASSLALVWPLALPIAMHIGLKLLVLASLLWSLRKAGWLMAGTHPFRLRLTPSTKPDTPDRIEIGFVAGRAIQGEVVEGSLVLAHLVVLRLRPDGARWWRPDRSWLLLPDSMPADDYRRLRVRLRWGRAAPV